MLCTHAHIRCSSAGRVDLQYFFIYLWPPGHDNDAHMAFGESIRQKLSKHALSSQASDGQLKQSAKLVTFTYC